MNISYAELADESLTLDRLAELMDLLREAFGGLAEGTEITMANLVRYGRVFIARDGDRPVGMLQTMRRWENPDVAQFVSTGFRKEYQSKDIALGLARFALERLTAQGFKAVEINTLPRARRPYERFLGFESLEMRKDFFGPGEDRLHMRKELR